MFGIPLTIEGMAARVSRLRRGWLRWNSLEQGPMRNGCRAWKRERLARKKAAIKARKHASRVTARLKAQHQRAA